MEAFPGYPSPDERDAGARRLAALAGGREVTFGRSVRGQPLLAFTVPARIAAAPKVLCAGNIHGLEWIATRVALGLLEALAADALPALRDACEVWVAPTLNPDGYARTHETGGAAGAGELRTNANGVDLNRNFPLPPGRRRTRLPWSGSATPGRATYRGVAPLSEPESRALDDLVAREGFHAVLSLHSTMGTLLPARAEGRAQHDAYRRLCARFAEGQRRFRYRRVQVPHVDITVGRLEDPVHHRHRAWAVCVEEFPILHSLRQHLRAPSPFWRFNPRRPEVYVENDVPGIAAFFEAAVREPRPDAAS